MTLGSDWEQRIGSKNGAGSKRNRIGMQFNDSREMQAQESCRHLKGLENDEQVL